MPLMARDDSALLHWPVLTGELTRHLDTTEALLADAIRRGRIDAPPVRAGRRLWWPRHARAAAKYLGLLTHDLAAEFDLADSRGQ